MKEYLVVDGYNMIGAWPVLSKLAAQGLEEARDALIMMLSEYQGFTGMKVILVFDAHQVPGLGMTYTQGKLDIRFTKEKETADECIERLVGNLIGRRQRVYVATSDMVEQHVIFGKGALRLPARELYINIQRSRRELKETVERTSTRIRNSFGSKLPPDMQDVLERWRRGEDP